VKPVVYALVDLWRRHVPGTPHITKTRWVASHADLPEHLPRRALLVVGGTANDPKWAMLACPCGSGHQVAVPLRRAAGSTWRLSVSGGLPSLYPSIDDRRVTRCHFWLRDGTVRWSPDRRRGRTA
jgi:hypothetical protein